MHMWNTTLPHGATKHVKNQQTNGTHQNLKHMLFFVTCLEYKASITKISYKSNKSIPSITNLQNQAWERDPSITNQNTIPNELEKRRHYKEHYNLTIRVLEVKENSSFAIIRTNNVFFQEFPEPEKIWLQLLGS